MTTVLDNSQSAALAFALAGYAKDQSAPAVVTITRQTLVKVKATSPKKGRRVAAPTATVIDQSVEAAEKPATPSPNGAVVGVKLPAAGTIGAKAFLLMMRSAKDRSEKMIAIASYIGYDGRQDFAPQEMTAMAQAKREISPVKVTGPSREEIRQAQRSAVGYVAGMPDALKRTVQDLLGREQFAVDAREDHLRDSKDEKLSAAERQLALGLAQLEEERLVQIRADLAKYVTE